MSYTRTRHAGLGGIADVAKAATSIVEDPCLGTVASLVLRLHAAEQPARPAAPPRPGQPKPPPAPPAPPVKGIGLCSAVKPLRAVVYVRERPWLLPVGGAVIVGGLVALGYAIGRSR